MAELFNVKVSDFVSCGLSGMAVSSGHVLTDDEIAQVIQSSVMFGNMSRWIIRDLVFHIVKDLRDGGLSEDIALREAKSRLRGLGVISASYNVLDAYKVSKTFPVDSGCRSLNNFVSNEAYAYLARSLRKTIAEKRDYIKGNIAKGKKVGISDVRQFVGSLDDHTKTSATKVSDVAGLSRVSSGLIIKLDQCSEDEWTRLAAAVTRLMGIVRDLEEALFRKQIS